MAVKGKKAAKLTLGPVLFNWAPEKWRDFHFRMADEAPVDIVYIGEVVCSKRQPFFAGVLPDVVERLKKAGKSVVLSSLAMVMNGREAKSVRELAANEDLPVEVNDVSALAALDGRGHVIGPYINVYNEDTLAHLAAGGARRLCLAPEIPFAAAKILAAAGKKCKMDIEIQVFGRMPLALSARCYHARLHKLSKDSCQFVCANDPDGLSLKTLDDLGFLAVNGIMTMSDTYLDLSEKMPEMETAGIRHFRLSPQDCDMVKVAGLYRRAANGDSVAGELKELLPAVRFSDGYYAGAAGYKRLPA
ncbi:MAG: U32 family peptidase [Alphaproteobacteria bacterium]|nr:U32 family peptidase [Alphaproteobacteria bacterium]MDE2336189.1 U32 family peptidase [Alphaproteobacteria bacterium]